MIDILIPVLNRPQNAQKVVNSIKANTTVEHEITFIASPGDDAEREACVRTGERVLVVPWHPGPGDASKKWNYGYAFTANLGAYPFVFTAADDLEFTPDWDERILEVAERTGAGMVGSNDDANPLVKRGRHSTHSLFSRAYIDTVGGTFHDGPGIVYCEGYKHQWIDTEAVKAAMDRGEWAFARRSIVKHHHPFYDKTVSLDDTYRKALGDAPHDKRLYEQRLRAWTNRATVL